MSTASWLALLACLFFLRMFGQVVAGTLGPDWLPDFEAFDSGLLPYPVLLGAQIVILVVLVRTVSAHRAGRVRPSTKRGRVLSACGVVYAAVMLVRAVITIAVYGNEWWWHGAIPIAFHWVLAGFLMVCARAHRRGPARSYGRSPSSASISRQRCARSASIACKPSSASAAAKRTCP